MKIPIKKPLKTEIYFEKNSKSDITCPKVEGFKK
jgi:hypothetical protein